MRGSFLLPCRYFSSDEVMVPTMAQEILTMLNNEEFYDNKAVIFQTGSSQPHVGGIRSGYATEYLFGAAMATDIEIAESLVPDDARMWLTVKDPWVLPEADAEKAGKPIEFENADALSVYLTQTYHDKLEETMENDYQKASGELWLVGTKELPNTRGAVVLYGNTYSFEDIRDRFEPEGTDAESQIKAIEQNIQCMSYDINGRYILAVPTNIEDAYGDPGRYLCRGNVPMSQRDAQFCGRDVLTTDIDGDKVALRIAGEIDPAEFSLDEVDTLQSDRHCFFTRNGAERAADFIREHGSKTITGSDYKPFAGMSPNEFGLKEKPEENLVDSLRGGFWLISNINEARVKDAIEEAMDITRQNEFER